MRSGYVDDLDQRDMAMYRGRVASAIRGQRGQRLLRDCLAALDAMPLKRLIPNELVEGDDVCLLGAVGKARNVSDISTIDPENHDLLASRFDVARCLIAEIEHVNDECGYWDGRETPEKRWERVRKWVAEHITPATTREIGAGA